MTKASEGGMVVTVVAGLEGKRDLNNSLGLRRKK
jgi:hypothetical protein